MRKYSVFIVVMLIFFNTAVLRASIIDELGYVNEKTDFYSYINMSQVLTFISARGIDLNELDAMAADGSGSDTDRIVKSFGIKLTDINEFMFVMNMEDLEKKSGYLVFISFRDGKGVIPEEFKKNSVKLKSGTVYKASADDDVVFTKLDNFYIIGSAQYLESFMNKRSLKKPSLTARSSVFIKKASGRSVFIHLTVSEYLKNSLNTALNSGAGMARGLKENVFIQTLLSLESADWGVDMNDRIIFNSGMQGSKVEDSERLQMLCHTWIVGSSFIVSFADIMAARSGDEKLSELTADQKLMSWLQKAFGRIHVKQEDKGVLITFEMTSSETDQMISFIKKEMEKEKKTRAERIEREKISKLTQAVIDSNTVNVEKYIKEKYNINGFNTDGNTPLGVAALNGNVKMARLLLEKGAVIDFPDVDKLTPLHHAVKTENKDMVTFLLGKGSNVNAKSDSDITALHMNAMQGNSGITRILIAKGANINAVDADASTPLHYAASGGFIDVVKVLVEKKADPDMLNRNEQRAIDTAAQNSQTEVVEFLKTKFKQEPKNYSPEEKNSSEDFNMDDGSGTVDEGVGDPALDEDIE